MGVFLTLIAVATALLRWQVNEVLRTQAALRTEAVSHSVRPARPCCRMKCPASCRRHGCSTNRG